MNKPTFLFADEPTGNLDHDTGKVIIDLLCSYQKNHGMGLIISTHDKSVALRMDSSYILASGVLNAI